MYVGTISTSCKQLKWKDESSLGEGKLFDTERIIQCPLSSINTQKVEEKQDSISDSKHQTTKTATNKDFPVNQLTPNQNKQAPADWNSKNKNNPVQTEYR